MSHAKSVDSVLELVLVHKCDEFFHLGSFGMCNVSPSGEDLFSFGDYEVVHDFVGH